MKLKREDIIKQQKLGKKRPMKALAKWGSAVAVGLMSLVASPGQFLNLEGPIPLAFTF